MKILLYTENEQLNRKSGLGKAIEHQKRALELEHIPYTTNLKDKDYDILHINTWFIKSYFVARKAKRKGKKIVYHAHSTEEDYRNGFILANQTSKLIKWWLIKCYRLGDVIITPTTYSKQLLEGYKGLEHKKIVAISNGLELDFFKPNPSYRDSFIKRYHFKPTDKIVVGIGLYIRRKGIVDFVELAKRMPEYQFIWFGASPLAAATSDVKEAVNTKLPNLQFAGYVEQEFIREALGGCDVYIFPTFEETEGIPIIEACAMECNAIVRDIPIFEGWLEDGVNVYKAKDVDAFEEKIRGVLTGRLPSLTKKAVLVAKERDIRFVAKQLHAVYDLVLEKKDA